MFYSPVLKPNYIVILAIVFGLKKKKLKTLPILAS